MSNDFKAFAAGGGANALSPVAWAALTALLANGFTAGVARSEQVNTVLRQSTTVAAAVGEFISGRGFNAIDDGNVANLVTAFQSAVMNLVNANVVAIPSGMVLALASTTVPSGFIKANGAAVSRTTYASLFAAIGTTFGAGDGSTTFNVPDARAVVIRGYHDGRSLDPDYLSRAFGSYQGDMLGDHNHYYYSSSYVGSSIAPDVDSNGGEKEATWTSSGAVNGQSPVGSETRGKNIALLHVIKT